MNENTKTKGAIQNNIFTTRYITPIIPVYIVTSRPSSRLCGIANNQQSAIQNPFYTLITYKLLVNSNRGLLLPALTPHII
jgi:hypothetical protein